MKAAYIQKTGAPDVIQFGDLPKPEPKGAEVLVKVEAVSLNPIDTYVRSGMIPFAKTFPFIPGCDLAGLVEAVGEDVFGFRPGDRVWGSNQGLMGRQGTFAEYVCAEEHWLYPLPAKVSFEDAAAIALVGITAHLGLFQKAGLQSGETLLVNGAAGSVGSAVVQMGNAAGARVVAATHGETKMKRAAALGADVVLDYRAPDFAAKIAAAAPKGVDVWWETPRQPHFEIAFPAMAKRGRFILMAGRDARPEFPVGAFYPKDCTLFGFAMFNATPQEQAVAADAINGWLASGKIRACIDRTMKLADAAEAHRIQEAATVGGSMELNGKIVLVP